MFGTSSLFGGSNTSSFGTTMAATAPQNPNKDSEVQNPPDDTISRLSFSPSSMQQNFLVGSSWDNQIRCWEITQSATGFQGQLKAQQSHQGPVLDVRFNDDGTKVLSSSADKTAKIWDLGSNQIMQVAQHDAAVASVHYVKAPNYTCVMTSSYDKTIKMWDMRQQNPIATVQLPDKAYCVDVHYPMIVAGLANGSIAVYSLENGVQLFKTIEAPLKYQLKCISIFTDKEKMNNPPVGFALGSVEGRVAIQYVNPTNPKVNFTFKCHRTNGTNSNFQDVYVVNDINFHPQHGTLTTVGSDGRYSFWDKDQRTKLKTSEPVDQPITCSAISSRGELFAYAVGYDWSKGHEFANPQKKPQIFLRNCMEELRPRKK